MSDGHGDGCDESRNGNNLLELESAPGVDYISADEQLLCSQLHVLPGYYLAIKVNTLLLLLLLDTVL